MNDWLCQFLEKLGQAATLDDLNDEIFRLRDALGIDHVVYHSVQSSGAQYAALTYDPEWTEHYVAQDYARIDPVVQACFRQFRPVDWSQLSWRGKAREAFLSEALDAGVGAQGISVPIRGPSGQFALFTASSSDSERAWESYREAWAGNLVLVAHYVNQKALEIERGTDLVEPVTLSPRETDTLRMLAMGLSRAQAADAMTISEHTIRAYIETARAKLGAMNTTHAVARAMTQGLIAF